MAIFTCIIKRISRGQGMSIVAEIAKYRACKLTDNRKIEKLAVHSRIATLDDYMRFARAREAVVRLFHEKPSMLPALNFLPMSEWGKQDILSAKRWIRSLRTYRKTSFSFASPGAYRLFQRLPPSAASRICDELGSAAACGDQKNYIPRFMENLVQAQIGPK